MNFWVKKVRLAWGREEATVFPPSMPRAWLRESRPFSLRAHVSVRVDWPDRRVGQCRRDILALSFHLLSLVHARMHHKPVMMQEARQVVRASSARAPKSGPDWHYVR